MAEPLTNAPESTAALRLTDEYTAYGDAAANPGPYVERGTPVEANAVSQSSSAPVDVVQGLRDALQRVTPPSLGLSGLLGKIGDALVGTAEAVEVPPMLTKGTIAHLLISTELMIHNPGIVADWSLEKLMFKAAPFHDMDLAKAKKLRPDLAHLGTLRYWEIKSRTTILNRMEDFISKLEAYDRVLVPGDRITGIPGTLSVVNEKGIKLSIEYDLILKGLIEYVIDLDITKLLLELGRKVLNEFVRRLREDMKKLLEDETRRQVVYALAMVVIFALVGPALVSAGVATLAASAVELMAASPILLAL